MIARVIVTSLRHVPLVVTVMWNETTLTDVEHMATCYRNAHRENRRLAFLVDSRRVSAPGAPVRRALADMTNELGDVAKRNTIGTVVVMDSAILIGALTAVRW